MSPHREVPVDDLSEVVLSHLPEGLCEVVHDEAVMVGKEIVPHLRNLPTREVEVEAIDESHVVTDHIRHWCKQVARLDHDVHGLVRVAEHSNARVPCCRLVAALKRA